MLFFRFSVMALIAFGSMVSGRFLARGFLENRGLKTESWTEDVFQRDILDETASAITSDGTTRDPQNNIKGDVDDTQLETPKEIALGTLSDGTTGDQKNEVGGVVDDFEGDTQMDVSNENPSYYDGAYRLASEDIQVNLGRDVIEAREEMRQNLRTYVICKVTEASAGVKTIVVDVKSKSNDWNDFFSDLQRHPIGYAIHVLPDGGTLLVTNGLRKLDSEETNAIFSRLTTVAAEIAEELGYITAMRTVDDFASLINMEKLYAPCSVAQASTCQPST